MLRRFAIALCTAALLSCKGDSPTEPPNTSALNGTWEGGLAAFPTGEDWTHVRLSMQTVGTTSSGTLTSRNNIAHPVSGDVSQGRAFWEVNALPQTTPCRVVLVVTRATPRAIEGSLSGRCPNTLVNDFRLEKVP